MPLNLLLCCLAGLILGRLDASPQTVYVSPSGNDSLRKARDEVRRLRRKEPGKEVTVRLRGGTYELRETLLFTKQDSGAPEAPITYEAHPGEEVRIIGGRRISRFMPVQDPAIATRFDEAYRDEIREADLRAAGIADTGAIQAAGPAPAELFAGGRPMQLARWPNPRSPNLGWTKIAGIPGPEQEDRIIYVGGRPRLKRWDRNPDVWMRGFWIYDWWDGLVPLKSIDFDNQLLISEQPFVRAEMANQTSGKVVNRNASSVGQRYYVLNVLDEIDEPGEYYVDRAAGKLYFWPPASGTEDVYLSLLTGPLLRFEDASHIRFSGITFEYARGNGIEIEDGESIRVERSRIRNVGNKGVTIVRGWNHVIANCEITETGEGGVSIHAGDKLTLKPSGHTVRDSEIHHYARLWLTYKPAVDIKGVGVVLERNHFHHAPHAGVLLDGNDHRLEHNEFDHLCTISDDCGGFYSNGLNWVARGTTIRFNSFHDILGIGGKSQAPAVYLDDFAGSTTVFGNVFYRTMGVKIGGGRSNEVENNIFAECDPAISLDGRGLTWASASVTNQEPIRKQLQEVRHDQPPYRDRYPELMTLLDNDPGVPRGNRINRNIFYRGKGWIRISPEVADGVVEMRGNWKGADPGFRDAAAGDYRLRNDAPVFEKGFERIPFEYGPRERSK
jgi:hypothetical protein